jgi:tRNA A-37 threonylcarbamoyl transferase component Bud32
MEYAEGYTISTADNSENVIYANIRLLLETGYLHLDLNYGNVMVSGENVRLIDFGKSKKILDLLKNDKDIENFNNIHTISIKDVLDANDIIQLINYINYFDRIYGVYYNLFQQNFTGIKKSYKDIADKLNARQNKTIHLDLTNRINNIDNSSRTRKRSIFDSPPGTSLPKNVFRSSIFDSPQGNVLFDSSHDNNENMNPNFMYTPPKFTGYRGGTKRKYKNKSKKTRKNKSNKKRVKLISKK